MTITLLPQLLPFVVGFVVLAGLGLLLAVVALVATTPGVQRNRRVRLARHESVVRYYGHLALSPEH